MDTIRMEYLPNTDILKSLKVLTGVPVGKTFEKRAQGIWQQPQHRSGHRSGSL